MNIVRLAPRVSCELYMLYAAKLSVVGKYHIETTRKGIRYVELGKQYIQKPEARLGVVTGGLGGTGKEDVR